MSILRHNISYTIHTDLDTIEDLLNFIVTLNSLGFTSDLLRDIHGFTNTKEIKTTAKLIGLHVNNAISLAQQGFSSHPETSFLPLYYSTLNLAKAYLLMMGKRKDLEKNRWHGAKYKETEMTKQFPNEKILVTQRGTIPLIYNVITGKSISKSGLILSLDELYRNITSIGAEYSTILKKKSGMLLHKVNIVKDDTNGHYLKVIILDPLFSSDPPSPRKLHAYPGLKIMTDEKGISHYETKKYIGNYETIEKNLINSIKRYLNSEMYSQSSWGHSWFQYTPINGRKHVLNEDLCILLAYFHLSNVVRYNPEHLSKLMDSKYWSLMLGLRKHGFLRFEKLMWGNYNKKSFDIS